MDILGEYARDLDFRLDFYVGVEDMSKLIQVLDDSDHPMVDMCPSYRNVLRFFPSNIHHNTNPPTEPIAATRVVLGGHFPIFTAGV